MESRTNAGSPDFKPRFDDQTFFFLPHFFHVPRPCFRFGRAEKNNGRDFLESPREFILANDFAC